MRHHTILPRLLSVCLAASSLQSFAQSPAQVLSLPEIIVTSFRGRLQTGKTLNGGTSTKHQPLATGQPLSLPTGTRLDIFGDDGSTHALVAFSGIGGCMISRGSSLRIPEATETDMTVTFDRHISGFPNLMLLNINAAEMAKHGGAVFRTKNKFSGNPSGDSPHPKMVLTTQEGRFFILQIHDTGIGRK